MRVDGWGQGGGVGGLAAEFSLVKGVCGDSASLSVSLSISIYLSLFLAW